MRAAEHERVDAFLHQRADILHDDFIRDRALQPAFFDQRHEQRAGARRHADIRIRVAQGAFIRRRC